MFMTPHTSVALWLSTRISNPLLAFVFSFLAHFILDIIPHGDEELGTNRKEKNASLLYFYKITVIDAILSGLFIYLFVNKQPHYDKLVVTAALLGAWLPDFAWLAAQTFKIKILYWYIKVHNKIHHLLGWQISLVYGVPFQIMVTLFMMKLTF
jgi:hypothetical protein